MKKLALFLSLALAGGARGDVPLDPANLHVTGSGSFGQSGGGTDWTTLPGFNGAFDVTDVSNGSETISPWHVVLAVPGVTGSLADSITRVAGQSVSIGPLFQGNLASGSAYDVLGLSGAPGSVSFTNFQAAYLATVGGPAPSSYGIFDFGIGAAALALLPKAVDEVDLAGFLPAGTVIFAYGLGNDGALYTTAMTNVGVVTHQAASTPEPSAAVIAALGAAGLAAHGFRRRRRLA